MSSRWVANKFGLVNFWYYDEQEYELANGKVIFRGSNGSGKSVTTQSFIPLLLDGDKRPNRLDPFRSNSRKLENYLLMDEDEDDRTAYLYLEFYKEATNSYLTIGMGLRARKGKALDSWYFILKDGRRIGKDMSLYEEKGNKYCLTYNKLKNRLGDGNYYGDSQGEYMRKVNEHLFGYSDIDDYKDLLNLLIELRSPKLSKDFKPTKIYEILNKALGTLSDEDLYGMSEAMDNMDILQKKLEQGELALKSSNEIYNVFMEYNKSVIYGKARDYIDKHTFLQREEKKLLDLEESIDNKKNNVDILNEKIKILERELESARAEEESLRDNDGFKIKEQIEGLKEEVRKNKRLLEDKENKKSKKNIKRRELEKYIIDSEYKYESTLKYIYELLEEESILKDEIYFDYIGGLKGEIESKDFNFNSFIDNFEAYSTTVDKLYNLMVSYDYEKKNKEEKEGRYYSREKERNKAKKKYDESIDYLTTIKSEYIDKINKYLLSTMELRFSEEKRIEIFKSIQNICGFNELHATKSDITYYLDNCENNYKRIISELEEKKSLKYNFIYEKEQEIVDLEGNRDNFYEECYIKEIKKIFDDNSIEYMDLFRTIDFKDSVDIKDRIGLESALDSIGYLKGLVIPSKYKDKVINLTSNNNYRFIFADGNKKSENIAKYFSIEDNDFTKKYSNELLIILESISVGENISEIKINSDYSYNLGVMKGSFLENYELKYIGAQSRENHIERAKASILADIDEINNEIMKIDSEINSVKSSLESFLDERDKFPMLEDIISSIDLIEDNLLEFNNKENEFISSKDELYTATKKYEEIRAKIYSEKDSVRIPNDLSKYKEVKSIIGTYRKLINEIKDKKVELDSLIGKVEDGKIRLEEIITDIEELQNEICEIDNVIELFISKKATLDRIFDELNIGELEEKLNRVVGIIKSYPEKISHHKSDFIKLGVEIKSDEEKRLNIKESIDKENKLYKILYESFEEERALGYINEVNELKNIESAKFIIKNFNKDLLDKENENLNKLYEYMANREINLIDYNIRKETIFSEFEIRDDEDENRLLRKKSRIDLIFKVEGRTLNIKNFNKYLEEKLEALRILISEEERRTLEDTLIKTLSTKISAKIYNANNWVKDINNLMNGLKTSNGLKLHLVWKSKTSEGDGELSSRELTDLLKQSDFISQEQRSKLVNHFKEKLKKAKRLANDSGENKSYQSIIKDVLDYRQWYEFKLEYTMGENGKRKELTDNAFFRLSGGEKAMSMYIPLFAAVNSRYSRADKKDCPRIIALDEAFAGVDEENISGIFELLEGLKLDYILNSQVLWGTYETVKNLAIYEIIREDDDIIIPMKYKWNGKIKTLES